MTVDQLAARRAQVRPGPKVRVIPSPVSVLPVRPMRDESIPRLVSLARVLALIPIGFTAWSSPPTGAFETGVLGFVTVQTAVRLVYRRRHVAVAWVELVLAAAVLALTGGPSSMYAPYALMGLVAGAFVVGPTLGAVSGGAVAATAAFSAWGALGTDHEPGYVLPWLALFPVVGLASGMSGKMRRDREHPTSRIVADANRALSSLYRIAQTMPGGLETGNVAAAALEQIRRLFGSPAAAVVMGTGDGAVVAGSYGIEQTAKLASLAASLKVPSETRICWVEDVDRTPGGPLSLYDQWFVVPLRRRSEPEGVVLAAVARVRETGLIEAIAGELAAALENARLFERVRRLSIDEERNRVGRDLHDGVAQALTHIRFELDMLARGATVPEQARSEAARLSQVAQAALTEVRATIAGLRSPVADGRLAATLRAHMATLRGPGVPSIRVECESEVNVDQATQDELYKIAQEAVSNAVRHARASEIVVRLSSRTGLIWMEIEDDGIGVPEDGASAGGVGLNAMAERAAGVGGHVNIRRRSEGGTCVEVVCRAVEVPA